MKFTSTTPAKVGKKSPTSKQFKPKAGGGKAARQLTQSETTGYPAGAASEEDVDALFKRKYDTISDEDRLKLILLIKDFGMSCHKASKVLNIAYNNAKVIYRIYKNEKRIRQTPK